MRKILLLLLSLALVMGVLAPAAFAGRCSETGDCGTGGSSGGGGGGDGYAQRESGLWVPNQDGYIQQRTPTDPAFQEFGRDVAKQMAVDTVKDSLKASAGAVAVGAAAAVRGAISSMTRSTVDWFIGAVSGPILAP